jgi:hypothetical protein
MQHFHVLKLRKGDLCMAIPNGNDAEFNRHLGSAQKRRWELTNELRQAGILRPEPRGIRSKTM